MKIPQVSPKDISKFQIPTNYSPDTKAWKILDSHLKKKGIQEGAEGITVFSKAISPTYKQYILAGKASTDVQKLFSEQPFRQPLRLALCRRAEVDSSRLTPELVTGRDKWHGNVTKQIAKHVEETNETKRQVENTRIALLEARERRHSHSTVTPSVKEERNHAQESEIRDFFKRSNHRPLARRTDEISIKVLEDKIEISGQVDSSTTIEAATQRIKKWQKAAGNTLKVSNQLVFRKNSHTTRPKVQGDFADQKSKSLFLRHLHTEQRD